MSGKLLELFPEHGLKRELEGLYLQEDLRNRPDPSSVLVYANFITSLDGRIAVPHPEGGLTVPDGISNPRDWRLFQELAVQADVLLSSGRYLREYSEGRAQELLRVYDDPALADLGNWRLEKGLDRYPAIAFISASLDFPLPPALIEGDRKIIIITCEDAPEERKQELMDTGLELLFAGKTRVTGGAAVEQLAKLDLKLIYSAAGPQVLHMLLEAQVLNRMYLTYALRILGGEPYATLMEGSLLKEPAGFKLKHLYLDPHAPGAGGQLFAAFTRANATSSS